MTDLVFVPANIEAMPGARLDSGLCGSTAQAGDVMYKSPDDDQWRRAAAGSSSNGGRKPSGIALNNASPGQPIDVLLEGDLTVTAVLTAGTTYYLSANAGQMCPRGDLATGMDVCLVGVAKSTTVLVVDFIVPGFTL
jgi:hypothetical protein